VIAFAIFGSVIARRPLMSAGLKPYLTNGKKERIAAWELLISRSATFRRLEREFSLIWATALLADCVARFIGAYRRRD
jgi:hypothetical protein